MECQGMSSLCSQVPCFFFFYLEQKQRESDLYTFAEQSWRTLVFLCPVFDASAGPRAEICIQRCFSSFHSRGLLRCSWVEVSGGTLPSPCPTSDCPGLPLICVHTARNNSKRLKWDTGSVRKTVGFKTLNNICLLIFRSVINNPEFQGCW